MMFLSFVAFNWKIVACNRTYVFCYQDNNLKYFFGNA